MFLKNIICLTVLALLFSACSPTEDKRQNLSSNPEVLNSETNDTTQEEELEKNQVSSEEANFPIAQSEDAFLIIDYQNQSVGRINMNTTKEEAEQFLTFKSSKNGISVYEEGINIEWGKDGKVQTMVTIKGIFYFDDPEIESIPINDYQIPLGSSSMNDLKEEFNNLYSLFEFPSDNCFAEQKCAFLPISIRNTISFIIPKMIFTFEIKEEEKQLVLKGVQFLPEEMGLKTIADLFNPVIDYENQSIQGITFSTSKEEIDQNLTLKSESNSVSEYEEGIIINWDNEGKIDSIGTRKGVILFDDLKTHLVIGSPIINMVDLQTVESIENFFNGLYSLFETPTSNCIKENKCSVIYHKMHYLLILPKIKLLFYLNLQNGKLYLVGVHFHKETTVPEAQADEESSEEATEEEAVPEAQADEESSEEATEEESVPEDQVEGVSEEATEEEAVPEAQADEESSEEATEEESVPEDQVEGVSEEATEEEAVPEAQADEESSEEATEEEAVPEDQVEGVSEEATEEEAVPEAQADEESSEEATEEEAVPEAQADEESSEEATEEEAVPEDQVEGVSEEATEEEAVPEDQVEGVSEEATEEEAVPEAQADEESSEEATEEEAVPEGQ